MAGNNSFQHEIDISVFKTSGYKLKYAPYTVRLSVDLSVVYPQAAIMVSSDSALFG